MAQGANTTTKELRQKKLIDRLKKEENWMKWGLFGALIIILLLLLFIGYATDWMAGLRKDSSVTPLSSTLDSTTQGADAGTGTGSNPTQGSTSSQGSTANTGTKSSTDTTRSSNTSTNTTTNNTTNTTTPTPTTPPNSLLNLYTDSNVGTSIDDLISRANGLGVDVACADGLLVTDCTFSVGDYKITTKSLLGTGLTTSILKNF